LFSNQFNPYLCSPNIGKLCLQSLKSPVSSSKFQKVRAVPHIEGNAGDQVEFSDVLFVDTDGKISVGADAKVKVKAEIVAEKKGKTVIAFKMKRRKGFRKKKGHRTLYTQIKVTGIA
jgi:large subunit ribosomal protein L21